LSEERGTFQNGFLNELQYLLQRSTVFTSADLLQPVIASTSFDEIEAKLRHMKALVESHPFKEDKAEIGWGIVL
jgi:hypothetical protein